LLPHDAMRLR